MLYDMQQTYIDYYDLFQPVMREAGITWTLGPLGDRVLRTEFTPAEDDPRTEEAKPIDRDENPYNEMIKEALARIGERVDRITWMAFPHSQPDDLGERLNAYRLTYMEDQPWHTIDLSGFNVLQRGVDLQLTDDFETWGQLAGMVTPEIVGGALYTDTEQTAAGAMLISGQVAGIFHATTPAMRDALLAEARDQGCEIAWRPGSPLPASEVAYTEQLYYWQKAE